MNGRESVRSRGGCFPSGGNATTVGQQREWIKEKIEKETKKTNRNQELKEVQKLWEKAQKEGEIPRDGEKKKLGPFLQRRREEARNELKEHERTERDNRGVMKRRPWERRRGRLEEQCRLWERMHSAGMQQHVTVQKKLPTHLETGRCTNTTTHTHTSEILNKFPLAQTARGAVDKPFPSSDAAAVLEKMPSPTQGGGLWMNHFAKLTRGLRAALGGTGETSSQSRWGVMGGASGGKGGRHRHVGGHNSLFKLCACIRGRNETKVSNSNRVPT